MKADNNEKRVLTLPQPRLEELICGRLLNVFALFQNLFGVVATRYTNLRPLRTVPHTVNAGILFPVIHCEIESIWRRWKSNKVKTLCIKLSCTNVKFLLSHLPSMSECKAELFPIQDTLEVPEFY